MTDLQLSQRHETTVRTDRDVSGSDRPARHGPALLCERLGAQYPEVDPDVIGGLVRDAWEESSRFRIKDFRIVLVERAASARLEALAARAT